MKAIPVWAPCRHVQDDGADMYVAIEVNLVVGLTVTLKVSMQDYYHLDHFDESRKAEFWMKMIGDAINAGSR